MGNHVCMTAVASRELLDVQLAQFFREDGTAITREAWFLDFDEIFGKGARAPGGGLPRGLGDMFDEDSLLAELEKNEALQQFIVSAFYIAGSLGRGVTWQFSNKESAFIDLIDWLPPGLSPSLARRPFIMKELAVVVGAGAVGKLFDAVDGLWAQVEAGRLENVGGLPEPERGMICLEESIRDLHELSVAARAVDADFVAFHY